MNWLLLRGLAREQRHWHDFPSILGARVGRDHVHLLDVAGVGTEHARLPRPSVPWLARDVARRLCELPGDGNWSVLGLSLGGMLALELCKVLGARVQQAVIINASSRVTPGRMRLRAGAAAKLARIILSGDPVRREELVLELTSSLPGAERVEYARRAAGFAIDAPVRRGVVLRQLLAAARFVPPRPPEVSARLLFLASRDDAVVSPVCTLELARLYGARYEEHAGAGHDLPLDAPDWSCERIAAFEAERAPPRHTAPVGA